MTENREKMFQRNSELEKLLVTLNTDLQSSENRLLDRYMNKPMDFPLILVMGPLRSGTTLFTQWLGNTGLFAYPTNLLSRFYQAPILGAKIQLLLTDPRFNFRDELGEFVQQAEYTSENGKTKGVLAPNEFWYFWRRFLADPGRDVWTDDELRQTMDVATLKAELIGVMDVFQKPFATKGMLFNYNIPFLNDIFEKVLFVHIERDHASNVASILEARKRQLGSDDHWYSFKIPEYDKLRNLDPISQAAGQVHYINKSVSDGLSNVDDSRKLYVKYESFCSNPKKIFYKLTERLGINHGYEGVPSFQISRAHTEIDIMSAMQKLERLKPR